MKGYLFKFFLFLFDFIGDVVRMLYDKEDSDRLSINRTFFTFTFSICVYYWIFKPDFTFPDSLWQILAIFAGGIGVNEGARAYRYKGIVTPTSTSQVTTSTTGKSVPGTSTMPPAPTKAEQIENDPL